MMKTVVRALETGPLGEISVVAFFVAFVLIVIYAFTLSRQERQHGKEMPLDDPQQLNSPSN
jgi:cbb3-type cytochrome oxidase subunit 3